MRLKKFKSLKFMVYKIRCVFPLNERTDNSVAIFTIAFLLTSSRYGLKAVHLKETF